MKSLSKFDARFDRGVQVSIDFLFELRNITDIQRSKIHRQLRSKNGRADALRFIRRKIREYITLKKEFSIYSCFSIASNICFSWVDAINFLNCEIMYVETGYRGYRMI